MRDLQAEIHGITNQEKLASFIEELANDFSKSDENWTNKDLPSFLHALAAWVEDMDGYYKNNNLPYDEKNISWRNIADMLLAATMYE